MFVRRWLSTTILLASPALTLHKPPPATTIDPPPSHPPTNPPPPSAPTTPQSQYDSLLDDECPWCVAMKKGPCGRQFATWQRCVKDIKAEQEQRAASSLSSFSLSAEARQQRDEAEYQRECIDYFRRLHECIHRSAQSRRYYGELINVKRDDEELDDDDEEWPDEDD